VGGGGERGVEVFFLLKGGRWGEVRRVVNAGGFFLLGWSAVWGGGGFILGGSRKGREV